MSPESIVAGVLKSTENCLVVSSTIVKIQQELLKEDRRKKAERSRSTKK